MKKVIFICYKRFLKIEVEIKTNGYKVWYWMGWVILRDSEDLILILCSRLIPCMTAMEIIQDIKDIY